MNPAELEAQTIKLKVIKVLDELHILRERNSELETAHSSLKLMLDNQKNTINLLEEKNKIVNIAQTLTFSSKDVHELKLKVNEYIREIDECIRLLSER